MYGVLQRLDISNMRTTALFYIYSKQNYRKESTCCWKDYCAICNWTDAIFLLVVWIQNLRLRDVIQWHKIDINLRFAGLSVPKLKETLRNGHRPYVCSMNLVTVFERSRYCIGRLCGVARGSHVGYQLTLLKCGDFRLFTSGCKDMTTGL